MCVYLQVVVDVVARDDLVEADPVKWQDFGQILERRPHRHYELQPRRDLQRNVIKVRIYNATS